MLQEEQHFKQTFPDETDFLDCLFEKVDFSSHNLNKVRFRDCRFENCQFPSSSFELSRLQTVVFVECKFLQIDFTKLDPSFLQLHFQKCQLRGCNFTDMVLKTCSWVDCEVRDCFFTQANLEKGSFFNSDLKGTVFHQTNLKSVNFLEATNYTINPLENKIQSARFSRIEALALLQDLDIKIED